MESPNTYIVFFVFSYIGIGGFSSQTHKEDHRLNNYINYYVPLRHQRAKFQRGHRTKFYFRAFDIDFNIELFFGSQTLDPQTKISVNEFNKSKIKFQNNINNNLVNGRVIGVSGSKVFGRVSDDVFYGIIRFPSETYYIEPAKYFFKEETSFKSIIYRFSDVNLSRCHFEDFSRDVQSKNLSFLSRRKRGNVFKSIKTSGRNICTLRITIDHKYYELFTSRSYEDIVKSTVVILDAVNDVFKKTDFDMDGEADGIGFKIKDFVIWWSKEEPGYGLSEDPANILAYLQTFTSSDSSDVCLSLLITGRDFSVIHGASYQRGTQDGGICSPTKNKAVVSLFFNDLDNYAQSHPFIASFAEHLILHEFGHSFGANHDDDSNSTECVPGFKDGGPYVMISQTHAVKTNNSHRFSPCSRRDISKVFENLGRECFVYENKINSCGNGYVDSSDEECDCGQKDQCNTIDACCAPPGGYLDDKECNYRRNSTAVCSNREDKCCTPSCHIVPKEDYLQCNKDKICQIPSFCDGFSKECFRIGDLPDGTPCRGGLGKCQDGVCEDIICRDFEMKSCTCDFHYDICELCCSFNGKCTTAKIWGILNKKGNAFALPNGEHCAGGLGICQRGLCWLFNKTKSLQPHQARKSGGRIVSPTNLNTEPMNVGNVIIIILAVNFVPAFLLIVIIIFCIKHRATREPPVETRIRMAFPFELPRRTGGRLT